MQTFSQNWKLIWLLVSVSLPLSYYYFMRRLELLIKTDQTKKSKIRPSRIWQFACALLSKDSKQALISIHRDLLLDAREMRKSGARESAIRNKIRRQMIRAYLSFATAPLTRALRAPFRWRRD